MWVQEQGLEIPCPTFPGHKQKVELQGYELITIWDAGTAEGVSASYTTSPAHALTFCMFHFTFI